MEHIFQAGKIFPTVAQAFYIDLEYADPNGGKLHQST